MRRNWYASAVMAFVLLAVAACTGEEPATSSDPLGRKPGEIFLYGSDGNMLNGIGDMVTKDHPNAIAGMKGTMPLAQLPQSFRDRLRTIDGGLVDESYAGEAYDAVVISALAAQLAKTTNSRSIAAQINGVTTGGETCYFPATCLQLIKDGKDIAYKGITLGLGGFTDAGEPSASTYGILRFAAANHLDMNQTQYV